MPIIEYARNYAIIRFMKKLIKALSVILINIIILCVLLLLSDFIIWITHPERWSPDFAYYIKNPPVHSYPVEKQFNRIDTKNMGSGSRAPDGLQYTNKPIVIFGCSFAYGLFLQPEATFSHKLSDLLQCPVYNRAISGAGLQHMYRQTTTPVFYKQVPKSDTVIYVMIDDHYRRMFGEPFHIRNNYLYFHYKHVNNKFIYPKYDNVFSNFADSCYTIRLIRKHLQHHYIHNPKNADKITDLAVLYFIKSRKNMEKKWGNHINFNVVLYGDVLYSKKLEKKLIKNNFNVIKTNYLTKEDLKLQGKYVIKGDSHPTEAAWDLLTPLIAEKIRY